MDGSHVFLMVTMGAHCDLGLNPASHSCDASAPPLRHPANISMHLRVIALRSHTTMNAYNMILHAFLYFVLLYCIFNLDLTLTDDRSGHIWHNHLIGQGTYSLHSPDCMDQSIYSLHLSA